MFRFRTLVPLLALAAAPLLAPAGTPGAAPAADAATTGRDRVAAGKVAGCQVFPRNNWWNTDIGAAPVHPSSRAWMSHMRSETGKIWANFGQGKTGPLGGEPITVVDSSHALVNPSLVYEDESDQVGFPLGSDTRIGNSRDHHSVVVNADTCRVYEMGRTTALSGGRWSGGAGATWSLSSNALRPDSWTSANTAGTPILAGLLRVSEVRAGFVGHALNVTMPQVATRHVWPARHHPGPGRGYDSAAYPPLGARLRLDADFDVSRFRPDTRVVLDGLKHYGMVVMDKGPAWFFQGETSTEWERSMLQELKTIPTSAFEAVDTSSMMSDRNSGATR